jgi:uncharacterized repeat protein (TIGR01451 family)
MSGDLNGKTGSDLIQQQGTLTLAVSSSGPATVGQQQTFTVVITNPSAAAIDNAVGGSGVYTLNGTVQSTRASQGSCPRNGPAQFFCTFGTIAAGASITVTSVVTPTGQGTLTFESHAGGLNDNTSDFTSIDVAAVPIDMQLNGFASAGSPARNGSFSYTFQVKNSSPFIADAVTFTDTLPVALTIAGVATELDGSCTVTGQTVSCDLGDMPGGSQAIIHIAAVAPADPQTIVNTASISSATPDRNAANDSASVTVQIK